MPRRLTYGQLQAVVAQLDSDPRDPVLRVAREKLQEALDASRYHKKRRSQKRVQRKGEEQNG